MPVPSWTPASAAPPGTSPLLPGGGVGGGVAGGNEAGVTPPGPGAVGERVVSGGAGAAGRARAAAWRSARPRRYTGSSVRAARTALPWTECTFSSPRVFSSTRARPPVRVSPSASSHTSPSTYSSTCQTPLAL